MREKILFFIFCIVVGVYICKPDNSGTSIWGSVVKKYFPTEISGTNSVTTDNYANTTLEYYYYIPIQLKKNKTKTAPFLVMVPGLSGSGQGFVSQPFKDFAQAEGFVIIAPTFKFDDKYLDSGTSYQYPAAWSGKALNKILNDFISKQDIASQGLYLLGFSAGAQFSERYSLLYPNYVIAASINAPGCVTLPVAYQKTKFVISVGSKDESFRKKAAADFYNASNQLGIDVHLNNYDCGHCLSEGEINDSIAFFRNVAGGK